MEKLRICNKKRIGKFISRVCHVPKEKNRKRADHGEVLGNKIHVENICMAKEKLPWQKNSFRYLCVVMKVAMAKNRWQVGNIDMGHGEFRILFSKK